MSSSSRPTPQVNLFTGWPNPSLLPPRLVNEASNSILTNPEIATPALSYGADEGYLPLRQEIAKWLTAFYVPRDSIDHERICITGGASQNLACVLQTFTDPVYTRNVWMVAPTYFLACRIFEDSGFAGRLRAVPEDEEGVNLRFLSEHLEASEQEAKGAGNVKPKLKPSRPWRKIYKQIIYAVPTFANPSGRIMSLNRREELVRLARKYDALVVTDDVYDMLQWSSSPTAKGPHFDKATMPRIVDVDRYLDGGPTDSFGNAVSNGSFSKIIGPGCRTGWAEGTSQLAWGLSQTGSSRSGGAPSQLVASFIQQMLATSTLTSHINNDLQPAYARRYHKLIEAISTHLLPLGLTMPQADKKVAGGYFVWLTLPEGLDAGIITERALHEEGLVIAKGPSFRVQGDEGSKEARFESDIRLCFAWENEDLLEEGVKRMAMVVNRALAEKR